MRMAEQIAMADLISGGRVLSRLRARRRRGELVGQHQPRPQPRALRGVPRPDPQVLDRPRARSAGRASTTTSATSTRGACRCRSRIRRSGSPGTASPETAVWAGRSAATPTCPSWCPFEIARELFDFYRQGAAEAGRTVTPDNLGFLICAVTADTQGQGARGRPPLRLAHGADPARADRVLLARWACARAQASSSRCARGRARCRR